MLQNFREKYYITKAIQAGVNHAYRRKLIMVHLCGILHLEWFTPIEPSYLTGEYNQCSEDASENVFYGTLFFGR